MSHEAEAKVEGIFHSTDQVEVGYGSRHSLPKIGGGNGAPWKEGKTPRARANSPLLPSHLEIRPRACRIPTFPPPRRLFLSLSNPLGGAALLSPSKAVTSPVSSSHSDTSTLQGGYDVP